MEGSMGSSSVIEWGIFQQTMFDYQRVNIWWRPAGKQRSWSGVGLWDLWEVKQWSTEPSGTPESSEILHQVSWEKAEEKALQALEDKWLSQAGFMSPKNFGSLGSGCSDPIGKAIQIVVSMWGIIATNRMSSSKYIYNYIYIWYRN